MSRTGMALWLPLLLGACQSADVARPLPAVPAPTPAPPPPPAAAVTPTPPLTEIQRIIPQLGDKAFAARNSAQQKLLAQVTNSPNAVADCLAAYRSADDPEVKLRLEEILRNVFELRIRSRPFGFLGIHMFLVQTRVPNDRLAAAIQVIDVLPDSAAAAAGLKPGDVILEYDGHQPESVLALESFSRHIQSRSAGDMMKLKIQRNGLAQSVDVKLGPMSDKMQKDLMADPVETTRRFRNWMQHPPAEAMQEKGR